MDNSNYELDYKAMFENLYKKFEERFASEIEYFELLGKLNDLQQKACPVSKNIMKMSMSDQILVLRQLKALNDICATLQDKYHFEEEATEDAC